MSAMLITIAALVALCLPVYLKTGGWAFGVGLVVGIILIFAVVRIMNSHFRRADKYDKFYQIKWVCGSETISKLAIASHILNLASRIRGFELGLEVLRMDEDKFRVTVHVFLIDRADFERKYLSNQLDFLLLALEYEFGLLVDRSEVFRVLAIGYYPERIEFVPKTFELPATSK